MIQHCAFLLAVEYCLYFLHSKKDMDISLNFNINFRPMGSYQYIIFSKLLVLVHKPNQKEIQKVIAFLNNTKNIVLESSINSDLKKYSNYYGINW